MATIDSKGRIHGKAGSAVYRMYRGTQVVQGPTKPFEQTQASKESACEFGLASTTAKAIRQAFSVIHGHRHDGGVVNRFNSAVYRAVRASSKERGSRDIHDGDLNFLEGLEFNTGSKFTDALRVRPEVDLNEAGQVRVRLPEIDSRQDIRARIKNTEGGRYLLKFVLIGFNFRQEFYEYIGIKEVYLPKQGKTAAQELVFEGEVPEGCFLMLGVSFTFQHQNNGDDYWENMNSEGFSPAMILAAFAAGEEAEPGYGDERLILSQEARDRGEEGNAYPAEYKGKVLLEKLKELCRKKKRPEKKQKEQKALSAAEPGGLTGKRVKIE